MKVIVNPMSNNSYPIPQIGTKHICGNYEYSYGQAYEYSEWVVRGIPDGWGVKIIDNSQTDYVSPLTVIQGYPVTNMSYLFYNHPSPTFNLIDWDTSNVTNMSSMFDMCRATSIDVSSFNTSNVTDMNGMFTETIAISLDLSNFDTSKVIDMGSMFWGCHATTIKGLSNFNTSKVTNMEMMFYGSQETNLALSTFDTSNVTNMQQMFTFIQGNSLDLSSFDTSKVSDMEEMFALSEVKTLIVRAQSDADNYKLSSNFPFSITITIRD